MPTFKRLKEKHPSAVLMWFQNGKLWASRLDAQEAMRLRGERGKAGDTRQRGKGFAPHARSAPGAAKPLSHASNEERRDPGGRLEWKPREEGGRGKLDWAPKAPAGSRPPSGGRAPKLEWKPRGQDSARPQRKQEFRNARPARPKSQSLKSQSPKSRSTDTRDRNWRPGGDHKDPRQKYKDAKKAKWQRFKTAIRTRWESKQPKRRDEES